MQPWRFIRLRSRPLREAVHALVEQERRLTAKALGEREDEFMKLKVQGVLDAAEVLVVALPPGREAHVFGNPAMPHRSQPPRTLWLGAAGSFRGSPEAMANCRTRALT